MRGSECLAEAGMEPSVGSRGDGSDTALTETINGSCKAVLIHRRTPLKTKESRQQARLSCRSWLKHHGQEGQG